MCLTWVVTQPLYMIYNFSENHRSLGWTEECLVGTLGVSINPMKCCLCNLLISNREASAAHLWTFFSFT